jgi:hypothetical protein
MNFPIICVRSHAVVTSCTKTTVAIGHCADCMCQNLSKILQLWVTTDDKIAKKATAAEPYFMLPVKTRIKLQV